MRGTGISLESCAWLTRSTWSFALTRQRPLSRPCSAHRTPRSPLGPEPAEIRVPRLGARTFPDAVGPTPDASSHTPWPLVGEFFLRCEGLPIVERFHHVVRLRARLVRPMDDLRLCRHRLHRAAELQGAVVRQYHVLQVEQLTCAA